MEKKKEFSMSLRIYNEYTDSMGIVYYVNYLKFMERARTEFMRALGFGRNYILNDELMFVARNVSISYSRPARLDDELQATASIKYVHGATIIFRQRVLRDGEVLVEGDLTMACVGREGVRPRRIPAEILTKLEPLVSV
jgi:tol-pal system-associated acyl-CoA thioesterase